MVSFTFDDFPRSAYLTGGGVLEHYGVRGTYYAALGLMNCSNDLGDQFRAADLDALLQKGHELASHTYGHISCRETSSQLFGKDVEKGSKAVEEISGLPCSNFAYPFGHVTLAAKRVLASQAISARSIFAGFNGPQPDLSLLRANSLYGDLDALKHAQGLIAENTHRRSWLIFYTHDVRPEPSPYGCTPELFEAVVSCAVGSGCDVLTVQQALAEAGVQNGIPEGHVRERIPS